ncbi:MAG: hypothetical protein SH848_09390 [Saprospiraceae bacterium]|nr:hypothetical protein [Saprospiraceae bacterium]
MIIDGATNVVKCKCEEGCAMYISAYHTTLGGGILQSLEAINPAFTEGTSETVRIDSISLIVDVENLTEVITYTYIENGAFLSKTYLLKYSQNTDHAFSLIGPTWEVDCKGHCNAGNTTDKCIKEWHASTGKVQCGCESDFCKMTVTKITE